MSAVAVAWTSDSAPRQWNGSAADFVAGARAPALRVRVPGPSRPVAAPAAARPPRLANTFPPADAASAKIVRCAIVPKQPRQYHFAILGAVRRPGVYALPVEHPRLGDLIVQAGGLTPHALGDVRIVRSMRSALHVFVGPRGFSEQVAAGRFRGAAAQPLMSNDVVVVEPRRPRSNGPKVIAVAHTPATEAGTGAVSSIQLALLGVAEHPVVVSILPDRANVGTVLKDLGQEPELARHVRLAPPTRLGIRPLPPERAADPAAVILVSGDVVVLPRKKLKPEALPELPEPIVVTQWPPLSPADVPERSTPTTPGQKAPGDSEPPSSTPKASTAGPQAANERETLLQAPSASSAPVVTSPSGAPARPPGPPITAPPPVPSPVPSTAPGNSDGARNPGPPSLPDKQPVPGSADPHAAAADPAAPAATSDAPVRDASRHGRGPRPARSAGSGNDAGVSDTATDSGARGHAAVPRSESRAAQDASPSSPSSPLAENAGPAGGAAAAPGSSERAHSADNVPWPPFPFAVERRDADSRNASGGNASVGAAAPRPLGILDDPAIALQPLPKATASDPIADRGTAGTDDEGTSRATDASRTSSAVRANRATTADGRLDTVPAETDIAGATAGAAGNAMTPKHSGWLRWLGAALSGLALSILALLGLLSYRHFATAHREERPSPRPHFRPAPTSRWTASAPAAAGAASSASHDGMPSVADGGDQTPQDGDARESTETVRPVQLDELLHGAV
ncbi:MAG: hypothetical protein D6725_01540, partial [Planctomycetota bacterium]